MTISELIEVLLQMEQDGKGDYEVEVFIEERD